MIHIALVEDDNEDAKSFSQFIDRFSFENKVQFSIDRFLTGELFLTQFKPVYDIVFMDVQMPGLNGFEISKKLRKLDKDVILFFLTNFAQYAIKGYEVDALDYILKPISYYSMALKLQRALGRLDSKHEATIELVIGHSLVCLNSKEIKYIEVFGHKLVYHTTKGDFSTYGSIKKTEAFLLKEKIRNFARCNACFLVNLSFVDFLYGYEVGVGGVKLTVSRPKRKEFAEALNTFMAKGA